MKGLSLNKSSLMQLKIQDRNWAIKTPRPGQIAATIKTPKTKEKTDCGQQMVTAFNLKKLFELSGCPSSNIKERGIKGLYQRLDIVVFNSAKTASIKEARQQIRKGQGVTIDDLPATAKTKVPAYAIIKENTPIVTRLLAHAIKNINPTYPHLLRIDSETLLYLKEKEGVYKPKQLDTARLNRLPSQRRSA